MVLLMVLIQTKFIECVFDKIFEPTIRDNEIEELIFQDIIALNMHVDFLIVLNEVEFTEFCHDNLRKLIQRGRTPLWLNRLILIVFRIVQRAKGFRLQFGFLEGTCPHKNVRRTASAMLIEPRLTNIINPRTWLLIELLL
jgi:hypothetical protein